MTRSHTKAADGRKKTQAQIDEIGQGRVWTGEQALKLGLVDALGGLPDAIREARKLAKLGEKEDVGFALYPAHKGTLSEIFGGAESSLKLPADVNTMLTYARIAENEHFLFLMPYQIRVQ